MMRIFCKLTLWFLIVLSLLMLLSALLLQTPYVQKKLVFWIEKKSDGNLHIGKLQGILPFWLRLKEVAYSTPEMEASFNKIELILSPGALLFGHLSILKLTIHTAQIHSKIKRHQNPHFPFPIELHSFHIEHLFTQEIEDLTLSGMASLSADFFVRATLTHPKLGGSLIHVTLEGEQETETLHVTGSIQNPLHKITAGIEGFYLWSSEVFKGSLHGQNPRGKGSGDIELSVKKSLSLPSFYVERDNYTLQGSLFYDFATCQLTSIGLFLDSPFALQTTLDMDKEALSFSSLLLRYDSELLSGNLRYAFQENALTGEVDLEIHDFSLFPFAYPIEGSAFAHLILTKENLSFSLNAQQIAWKDLYIPEITMEGDWRDGGLNFKLNLPDFTVLNPAYEVFPLVHLDLQGRVTRETLLVNGHIWGLGESPFNLNCTLPIHLSFSPLDLSMDELSPFSLHLQGKGSIDPILAFLENASLIAHGSIDLDLTATGTWSDPHLEGSVIYDGGRIESLTTGALFRDIHMEMEGRGRELQILSLMAHDVDKGDLSGWGHISWDPHNHFPFAFHLYASRYLFLAIDPFTAAVDAEITLSGNVREMSIAGKATLVKGHLAIPSKMPLQVPVLEVCYLNPLPTSKPEEKKKTKTIPIHWDIAVDAPHHLTIDGRGLDSEWRGTLKISGEQNQLSYKGKLRLVQGRFSVINRSFDLVEGRVRIDGLDPKDIFVDLKGDYQLPGVTTSLIVVGTLDNTHLSFSSNPPMSTNQILSWILFQQDINELTPFQAWRLASLLVSLSGKYTGPKTFETIKAGLGIDVLSITDCDIDSADLTFQVGKYLSQGTFVGINKSISGDYDSVMIQTRLFRNFFLEADYGGSLNGVTSSGGKGILKWYKSY